MKNSLLFLLVFVSTSFLLNSCIRTNHDITPVIKKVKTVISTTNSTMVNTSTYKYDSQGRIIKITNSNYNDVSEYIYEKSSIIEYHIYTINPPFTHRDTIVYQLNNNNNVQKKFYNTSSKATQYEEFEYDTNGYRAKSTFISNFLPSYDLNRTVIYQASNGNYTSDKETNVSFGKISTVISKSYEFYNDKKDYRDYGFSFLGRNNTNLVKRIITIYDGIGASTTTYLYEFDADGYVIKQTEATIDAGSNYITTIIRTYTY